MHDNLSCYCCLGNDRSLKHFWCRLCQCIVSIGSTAVQLNPLPQQMGDADACGVRNMIESSGYFRGSSESWKSAVDGLTESGIALSALGELVNHLSRLKVG